MGKLEGNTDTETLIKTPKQLLVVVILSFAIPLTIILSIVEVITGGINISPDALTEESVSDRLRPSGSIQMAGSDPELEVDSSGPVGEIVSTMITIKSGEVVYNEVCAGCHMLGVAGAPKTGDKAQWSNRIAKGNTALYTNAIKGIGLMPAKGGALNLSDDEIKAAVDYLLKL